MQRMKTIWRDLGIVARAVWLNLILFTGLLLGSAGLMRLSGAYPQANWLSLLVNSFHMAVLERVAEPGDGIVPGILTFVLPLLSVITLGEGALRILTIFVARGEHREEWERMVAKSYSNHVVICGVGELGRALVQKLLAAKSDQRIVLIDPRPDVATELGLDNPNVCHIMSDMTNMDTLKEANCQKARLIILSSGNDSFNLEAAFKVLQLYPKAEIWVRLYRSQLADLLDIAKKPNVHFFCPREAPGKGLMPSDSLPGVNSRCTDPTPQTPPV
jgi:FlaA1/EpsC-like NDP-sugar epimerase